MTGRARGRARGRSRGGAPLDTVRPGEPRPQPTTEPQVGRGGSRGRGGGQQQQQQQQQARAPPRQQQQPVQPQQVSPPVEGMQALQVSGKKEPSPPVAAAATGRGGRGRGGAEPVTKPVHITDKRGSTGKAINVMSNYITMKSRPNCNLYQYNVSYTPLIESRKLRIALLYSLQAIGKTRAFDGMILYLPHKLPDQITKFTVETQRDNTKVEITITLTNELSSNSPICLQLFNIIFRK